MILSMDSICLMLGDAFDVIETELIGSGKHHSLRVASLVASMAKSAGLSSEKLLPLMTCALFHDNALTEHILTHRINGYQTVDLGMHCIKGQKNVEWLPFESGVDDYILHHHSCESGAGPFGVKEFPLEAAIIGAADHIDASMHLDRVCRADLNAARDKIAKHMGTFASREATELLLDVLNLDLLASLHAENIHDTIKHLYPDWKTTINDKTILNLADFIAHIIDCKSVFTRKHTQQIANRAWLAGAYYGYDQEEKTKLYLAAALHDIGKIVTPTGILEKPGKLDRDEYNIIMQHVAHTANWLETVDGLGDVAKWASQHHEKLDGSGYPFGLTAAELSFNSRLIACIDIYQAISEKRPYHEARSHEDTMVILYDMARKGLLDSDIVKDMDAIMACYSLCDIPAPLIA